MAQFRVHTFDQLKVPLRRNGKNNLSIYKPLIGCYGVYVFQNRADEKVLYVGESGTKPGQDYDLKKRIAQNYTDGTTGGTFRDKWKKSKSRSFDEFKSTMEEFWKLVVLVTVHTRSPNKEEVRAIDALEKLLILCLKPKYN